MAYRRRRVKTNHLPPEYRADKVKGVRFGEVVDGGRAAEFTYQEFLCNAKEALDSGPSYYADAWGGELSREERFKALTEGRIGPVERCAELIEQIEANARETVGGAWMAAPCGAYACVPEAIAGFPEPMRQWREVSSEYAPIRIVVSTSSDASCATDAIERRGMAVCALVMKLSAIRSVQLTVLCDMGGGNPETLLAVDIESTPLNIAQASYYLCDVAFARGTLYPFSRYWFQGNGCWLKQMDGSPYTRYSAWVRKVLALSDKDIYVPPMHYSDNLASTNPVEWVNARMREYLETECDE